jgi:hypothetical protein
VDEDGFVYAGTGNGIVKFDNKPGPAPPDSLVSHPAAVMLHLQAAADGAACGRGPSGIADITTWGKPDPDGGAVYYVYLLGTPDTREDPRAGLLGFQLGIRTVPEDRSGLRVWGWSSCGSLEFPTARWPHNGGGNTITWPVEPLVCQRRGIVVAGYFYVTAYAASSMSVVGYPTTGQVKVADCTGGEALPDAPLDLGLVGWISIADFPTGMEGAGCNPALAPCGRRQAVQPTTWGTLKRRFPAAGSPAPAPPD